MKAFNFVFVALILAAGCTDANRAQYGALGAKHRIEMYSGGKKVREWTSTGKPHTEQQSDGYFFVDAESEELVRVSGDIVVTQLK